MTLVALMVRYHPPLMPGSTERLLLNPAMVAYIVPADIEGWSFVKLIPGTALMATMPGLAALHFYVEMSPLVLAEKLSAHAKAL